MRMLRQFLGWSAWFLLVMPILGLAACGTNYPEDLEALQQDPMASPSLAGAQFVKEYATEAGVGLMGKPQPASILTTYRPDEGVEIDDIQREAVELAQQSGWDIENRHASVVQGTKLLSTGKASITISQATIDGERQVHIRLEHDFHHPG